MTLYAIIQKRNGFDGVNFLLLNTTFIDHCFVLSQMFSYNCLEVILAASFSKGIESLTTIFFTEGIFTLIEMPKDVCACL